MVTVLFQYKVIQKEYIILCGNVNQVFLSKKVSSNTIVILED